MTFPLINYDGNKGENNDDEAGQKTINHPPHWKAGHSYKNNLVIHRLSECSNVWLHHYLFTHNSTVLWAREDAQEPGIESQLLPAEVRFQNSLGCFA